MGRFSEKQLTILTIAVAVLVTGLFAALIFKDLSSIRGEENEIEKVQGQILDADAENKRMAAREADVIVYREIVQRDAAILPDETEINEFINVIGRFEKSSGVLVTQVTGLSQRERGKGKEAISKIPLKLKLRGSLEQFLKFINLYENHDRFVSISGFSCNRGNERDENGNLQHEISLELETYSYNPRGGPISRVEIPNYERRVEELAIQQRISQSKPAFVTKYTLSNTVSRRDPLVDPREDETTEAAGMDYEERYKHERNMLEQLILEVALLQLDVKTLEKLRAEQDIIKISTLAKAIDEQVRNLDFRIANVVANNQITISELKDQFTEKVLVPFEAIKKSVNAVPTEVVVTRRQVHEWLVKMQERFDAGDFENVVLAYEGYLRTIQGRQLSPDAIPLQEEMGALAQQAEIIARFEAEHWNIQGIIIDRDPSKKSFAIINGQIIAEGEQIDGEGNIKIHKIRSDEIEFIYDGVPIKKYLRRTK